jgi:hypothetical protein
MADTKTYRRIRCFVLLMLTTVWQGCAHHQILPVESPQVVYSMPATGGSLAAEWAPAFVIYNHGDAHNRIGRPRAVHARDGGEAISVSLDRPTIYVMTRDFKTAEGTYTNLIYRVHFPKIPFSLIPFHLTTGKNVGLMVVVTLDHIQRPVLITSVHTCGCYKAIVPTTGLPPWARPQDWTPRPLEVYGERLPAVLDYQGVIAPRLLVHVRPDIHRIMNLEVVPGERLGSARYEVIALESDAMESLTRLPLGDGVTSFFHESGLLKGYVKGSVKPLETILLSLPSLDLFVGADKIYADPEVSGNPFYTSLKPWRRDDSNMWFFDRFLHYWGWRL